MAQTVGVKAVFDTSQFNAGLKTYVNGMSVAQNVTVNVTKDVNNLNTAFNAGLGAAVGTAAISAINAIGNAVRNLGNEVIDLITRFENLGFTIRSLVASDLVNQGIAGDLAEGLERADKLAPALQSQLERIAILSKFDSFEVTSFFQKALIGGFKLNDALVITQDLIDFGAAQGRTPLQLDNILREIGQINIAGKVTGESIRDLRRNSFGLVNIINRALKGTDKTFEDIRNNSSEVLTLLFSQLKKESGGAAEEISRTFVGLLSSLRDIRQISLAKLFTPIGESVRPQLQQLVDLLSSPDFKASLRVIGELLGGAVAEGLRRVTAFVGGAIQAWQALDPAVKQNIAVFLAAGAAFTVLIGGAAALALAIGALVNPFTVAVTALSLFVVGLTDGFQAAQRVTAVTVQAIADYFTDLISAAADWGIALGQAFADGMVQAASVIVQAVNVIGDAISYLMAPGSPPRFLPDIDTWGTETAQVYLDGFTQADFSVLNQVGSSIRGILQNLVDSDQLSKVDVPRLVLGSEQAFSRAIADVRTFGQITEATLESIRQQAGPAADTVLQFAARYAEVVTATDAVTESQEELNRITKSYDALLNPLRDKLQGISNAGEDAREQQKIAALQRILANRGVSDGRKRVAQLEIEEILAKRQVRNLEQQQDAAEDVAQTQLTAAQQAQQEAESELQLFQSKIQAQTEQTQLQNEFLRLLKEETAESTKLNANIGSIGKSLKNALSPLAKQLKFVQLQKAELQDTIKEAKARAVLADANATAAQKATAELTLQEIALRRQQRILDARELGFSEAELTKLREVPVVLADIGKKGKSAAAGIKGALDLGGAGIDTGLLTQFNEKLDETRQRFADIKQQVIDTATTINEKLPDFLKLFPEQEGGEPPILTNLKKYTPIIAGIGAAFVGAKIVTAFRDLAGALGLLRLASVGLPAIITGVRVALGLLTGPVGIVITLVSGLAIAWQTNLGGIRDDTNEFVAKTIEQFNFLKEGLTRVFSKDGIGGVFEVFQNGVRLVLDGVKGIISEKIDEMVALLGLSDVLARFREGGTTIGEGIVNSIADGIVAGYTSVKESVLGLFDFIFSGDLLAAAKKRATDLGSSITDGIASGIKSAQDAANDALSFVTFGLLGQAEKDAQIKSPSRLFADRIGKPIGEGIAQGISEADTGGGIFTFITKIVTAFAGLVTSVVASTAGLVVPVSGVFTLLGANITTTTDTMVLAVNTSYQLMADTINTIIELMSAAIKIKFDALRLAVEFITLAMRNAVLIQYQTMDTEVNEAVSIFAAGVTAQIEALTETIVGLFDEMREGVLDEIETMTQEVLAALGDQGLLGDILDLESNFKDAGKELGKAMLDGVRQGLRNSNSVAEVISAIDGLAQKIENRLKEAFNISSPSKLMEDEVGAPIVEGIAAGMRNQIGAIVAAAQTIAAQTIDTLQAATAQVSPQTSSFVPANSSNVSNTNNFNLNVSSQASSQGVVSDFRIMEVLATV